MVVVVVVVVAGEGGAFLGSEGKGRQQAVGVRTRWQVGVSSEGPRGRALLAATSDEELVGDEELAVPVRSNQ